MWRWLIPLAVVLVIGGLLAGFVLGRTSNDEDNAAGTTAAAANAITAATAPPTAAAVTTPDTTAPPTAAAITTPDTTSPSTTPATTITILAPTSTSAQPSTGPGAGSLLDGHITFDGSDPLPTECQGLAGICLQSPLEALTAQLGPPTQRYAAPPDQPGMTQAWDLNGIRLVVDTDAVDAVSRIYLGWSDAPSARTSVGMGPIVGGNVTPTAVTAFYGATDDYTVGCAENTAFTTFDFHQGPEGSVTVEYGITGEFGSRCFDDPGSADGLLAALGDVPLTDVAVH
jgi:hypothetical protein